MAFCAVQQQQDGGQSLPEVKRRQAECLMCIISVLAAVLPQLSHLER